MDPKLLELLVCPVTKGPLDLDREKQELYESAVLSGSIILGLYEGRDGGQKTARVLARALLEQLMGITPERIHTEGDSVWVD